MSKESCLTKVNVNLAAILEYLNVWSALRRKVYCLHNQICHFCLLYCICVAAVCPVNLPPVTTELDSVLVLSHGVAGSAWCSVRPNPNPPINPNA